MLLNVCMHARENSLLIDALLVPNGISPSLLHSLPSRLLSPSPPSLPPSLSLSSLPPSPLLSPSPPSSLLSPSPPSLLPSLSLSSLPPPSLLSQKGSGSPVPESTYFDLDLKHYYFDLVVREIYTYNRPLQSWPLKRGHLNKLAN